MASTLSFLRPGYFKCPWQLILLAICTEAAWPQRSAGEWPHGGGAGAGQFCEDHGRRLQGLAKASTPQPQPAQGMRGEIRDLLEDRVRISLLPLAGLRGVDPPDVCQHLMGFQQILRLYKTFQCLCCIWPRFVRSQPKLVEVSVNDVREDDYTSWQDWRQTLLPSTTKIILLVARQKLECRPPARHGCHPCRQQRSGGSVAADASRCRLRRAPSNPWPMDQTTCRCPQMTRCHSSVSPCATPCHRPGIQPGSLMALQHP